MSSKKKAKKARKAEKAQNAKLSTAEARPVSLKPHTSTTFSFGSAPTEIDIEDEPLVLTRTNTTHKPMLPPTSKQSK